MQTEEAGREQLIAKINDLREEVEKLKILEIEQKKSVELLKKPEEQYQLLFNMAPIGLNIACLNGDILNANAAMLDLLGYTLEEYLQIHVSKLYVDPNGRQEFLKLLHASNQVRDFESNFKKKDGSSVMVLINADYVEIDQNKVLLTSVEDISHLKKIQEELKESEERYHLLFNSAPIGIIVADYEGNIHASNKAIQELLGYSPLELKSKKMPDFYSNPDERQLLLRQTWENGIVRGFETKYIRKDGTGIVVVINTDLIDYKNQHGMLLTSIRDITNRKQAEEELRQERDFTNAILDITASLMLVLDHQGKIIRFNRACEAATGYSFHEVKGRTMEMLSTNPKKTKEKVQSLLDGNYPGTHENVWISKNGAQLLISWTSTALVDEEGQVEYIIATGIDITESRKAELKLQKANQELTARVSQLKERTKKLGLMSELGDQLQSCLNVTEACAVSAQYIQKICPECPGAIYMINPSRDLAEAVVMWGDTNPSKKIFLPLECWAVRRGQAHLFDSIHPGLLCGHIHGPKEGKYLCMPMTVNGETIGILHLSQPDFKPDQENETSNEHKIQLLIAITEHMSLAIANLQLRETLRQQSIRDPLTGFYNRRFMEESLKRELLLAGRENTPVGLIMFDIDHFKEFNDLYGHDGGDALLRELGALFLKKTRGEDIVCRYGGDEFVIVFPEASLESTKMRAEELRLAVHELYVYHLGNLMGKCTLSLGVAVFPTHGQTTEELIKSVDNALYHAKHEGRDKVVVASVTGEADG